MTRRAAANRLLHLSSDPPRSLGSSSPCAFRAPTNFMLCCQRLHAKASDEALLRITAACLHLLQVKLPAKSVIGLEPMDGESPEQGAVNSCLKQAE
mmetsp:Transcript_19449/g.46412  ORF Transcript_19449/g.46412 Transcript_19449/m.46412 type:complete len:96 (+) Transcript_19449:1171-1458(+)